MSRDILSDRVERLEVTVSELAKLPEEVRSLGGRLGAVEGRLGAVEERLSAVEGQIVQLRVEMRDGLIAIKELGAQIETNWQRGLVLHEDVISRIKAIAER